MNIFLIFKNILELNFICIQLESIKSNQSIYKWNSISELSILCFSRMYANYFNIFIFKKSTAYEYMHFPELYVKTS